MVFPHLASYCPLSAKEGRKEGRKEFPVASSSSACKT
jgi:hypothetical protein